MISWIPLTILFVLYGRAPAVTTVWVPLFMVIEVVFAAGVTLAISSIIVQMRDLLQVLPLIISLGLFATPVIWPFSEDPDDVPRRRRAPRAPGGGERPRGHVAAHWVGGFNINLQIVYGFFNPLGPIIDNARRTLLLGQSPNWSLVGVAALGLGPLPRHRLPDLQAVGGELCRHCLTGPSRSSTSGRSSGPTGRCRSSTTR